LNLLCQEWQEVQRRTSRRSYWLERIAYHQRRNRVARLSRERSRRRQRARPESLREGGYCRSSKHPP